ncbi:MAG: magnesium transporter [Nitrosomonadales bacterium]|nr:magnesium transporter [Nitrosomonadales bacterium]
MQNPTVPQSNNLGPRQQLAARLKACPPKEAAELLAATDAPLAFEALAELNPSFTQDILRALPDERRQAIIDSAAPELARQWERNRSFEAGTIGYFMEPTYAMFRPEMTVGEAIEKLRTLVKTVFITYGYVTDPDHKLLGLVTMRDLLFAEREARLADIMLRNVFVFRPGMDVSEAMKLSISRHYPVYPVCDEQGKLLGLARGQSIFEARAFEITAQAGSMVGVDKEERISTPMLRSFMFRHPWLQLNLLTAFLAGGVVAMFQGTIDQLVILAVFLPVLAGQSGNTGCQALAVTLRGITLGEITSGDSRKLIAKEGLLGALNGTPIGVVSGIAMYVIASAQHSTHALMLSLVVFLAMVGACTISGISGAIVPLTLKRFGTDPATASSIFLTTATDVVSMGMLLGLATILIVW